MDQVFHLLYTSRSLETITGSLLKSILLSAREHNSPDQITGFLVVRNRHFLQLLEGEESKVRACFERILKDQRHSEIVVHAELATATRVAPSWGMGYVPWNDQMTTSRELIEIFESAREKNKDENLDQMIAMLHKFAKEAKDVS